MDLYDWNGITVDVYLHHSTHHEYQIDTSEDQNVYPPFMVVPLRFFRFDKKLIAYKRK